MRVHSLPAQLLPCVLALAVLGGCDIPKFTVNTTSKVLIRAQAGLQQESDWEMARTAIPGALKTVEGFWIVDPDNPRLIKILMEGYCSYGTGFVEDDWELAGFRGQPDEVKHHSARATSAFTRCLNYALRTLGPRWQKELFADDNKVVADLIRETPARMRTPMMYAGLALGSIIKHNLSNPEMMARRGVINQIMERVIEIDTKAGPPKNQQFAAMPYLALGMLYTATGRATGGDPEKGKAAFEKALELTDNKFLLARTLMAYQVGKGLNDPKFYFEQLKIVLETPPSVWPEQRLANEIAHRKARRYLSRLKEEF